MAFKEAKLVRYERFYDSTNTTIVRIFAAGVISDTAIEETRYHEYWIVGDEMAALPQPDPVTYSQPGGTDVNGNVDPHVLAVRQVLARAAKIAYNAWMSERAMVQTAPVIFPAEALAVQPAISPTEFDAAVIPVTPPPAPETLPA